MIKSLLWIILAMSVLDRGSGSQHKFTLWRTLRPVIFMLIHPFNTRNYSFRTVEKSQDVNCRIHPLMTMNVSTNHCWDISAWTRDVRTTLSSTAPWEWLKKKKKKAADKMVNELDSTHYWVHEYWNHFDMFRGLPVLHQENALYLMKCRVTTVFKWKYSEQKWSQTIYNVTYWATRVKEIHLKTGILIRPDIHEMYFSSLGGTECCM